MKKNCLFRAAFAALAIACASESIAHGVERVEKKPQMDYLKNAQRMKIKSMDIKGTNAYFQDIVSSNDPKSPITCGLFRMEKGNFLTYEYTYDEANVILEGSLNVFDGTSTVKAKAGDVLFFPKGSTIKFSSDNYGLVFICGQRARDGV